jgi:hypothetical protein
MSSQSTTYLTPTSEETEIHHYSPLQQAVFDRACAMSAKRAAKATHEHTFYPMWPGAKSGQYSLRSPNLDRDCRYPVYQVDIFLGTCTCDDACTHVARINEELDAVGLPPSVCCCHVAIVVEKLAAGWTPGDAPPFPGLCPHVTLVARRGFESEAAYRAAMEADFR